MLFNIAYDASVTAEQTAVINAVATNLQNHFTDPNNLVTINITVNVADITGLGASSTPLNVYTYANIRTNLINDQTTPDDGLGALPVTDPIPLSPHTYWMARAEAKALGLLGASAASDGTVSFDNGANLFDYNRADGITAGQFDFAGVVAHELTEIMGRTVLVGSTFGNPPAQPNSFELLDLYHYSGTGVRVLVGTTAGYFSLDNGTTNLDDFNTTVGGDFGDWASTTLVGNDSFLAFSNSGVINAIMNTDFRVMDILGYDLVNQTPTVAALSKSTGEDGPFSQSLIEGAADTDGDFLRAINLSGSVSTTSSGTLSVGTDYTLTESTLALTAAGLAKFNHLAAGATDTAVFAYNVTDFIANVADTLTLTINGANDTPTANSDTGSAGENETKSFDVLANDTDPDDGHTFTLGPLGTVTVTSANSQVSGINAAGAFTIDVNQIKFTPSTLFDPLALGETATVVVNYTMQDEHSATSSSTLTLTVNGANDAPVITSGGGGEDATYDLKVNFSAITTVVATDVDSGSSLSYSIFGGDNADLFQIDSSTGALSFKVAPIVPHNDYEVIVQVSDGSGGFDTQAITVNVTSSKMDGEFPGAGADTFVFHSGFGSNSVNHFELTEDFLQFDKGMFSADTAAAVLAAATDDHKGNTVIFDLAGDRVILMGVTTTDLAAHQSDILFV